jgi:hypothetical protein
MRISLLILGMLGSLFLNGQQITHAPKDSLLFKTRLDSFKTLEASHLGDSIVQIGKMFMGTPYVEKTLEIGNKESVVVNLRGLDCTTFVESVMAFNLLLKQKEWKFETFAHNLETIRYRNGILDGYPSRLHYFTDWIRNNEKKGMVKNITLELGGVTVQKAINFMGTHRNLYPFLADNSNYVAIQKIEKELVNEELCILPQDQIESKEQFIQSGDIIALATSIKGLDVTHTGIAIYQHGRLHLLHASSANGEVEITKEPLIDYLKKIKSNIGIIVARPL